MRKLNILFFLGLGASIISCNKQPIEGAWQVDAHNSPDPIVLYRVEFYPNGNFTSYQVDGSSYGGGYQVVSDSLFMNGNDRFKILNLDAADLTLQQTPGVSIDTFMISFKKL